MGTTLLTLTLIVSVTAVFLACFIFLYFYFTRNFKFWNKLGIPYVKPLPFVGNVKDVVFLKENIAKILKTFYDDHSDKPYVGIFVFDQPSLVINDLELMKNILVKDAHIFINRTISGDEKLDPLFGKMLFMLEGQRWRNVRLNLTTVFTSAKMKMMFHLVVICGRELVKYLDTLTFEGTPVDVGETSARFMTDVIASCAFGINANSLKNPDAEFRRYMRNVLDYTILKGLTGLLAFFSPKLKTALRLKFVDDKSASYFRRIVWNTVEYREKHGVTRNDFLDCMIEMRNKGRNGAQEDHTSPEGRKNNQNFEIDGDDFVAQGLVFILAGFETSGTTLSYALYELALHPHLQNRLRRNIKQVLEKHQGELTYEGMIEMSYLDMVIRETLRKYPPIPFLDRKCCSDYTLPSPSGKGTVILPAGTSVYIPLLGPHYDPKYFPDPEKFDPERFTEENKQSRPNYIHMPFGEGPRICIGMRFGLMQIKTGLIHILTRYEVTPCKDTPVPIFFDPKSFLLKPDGQIALSFKRI